MKDLVQMVLSTSVKALMLGKSQAEGGDALGFLQNDHLPPWVIPDILNRESILASSATLPKVPSQKNLKGRDS
jgi:hypothetical protein